MTDKERFEELAYNVGISLDGEKAMMSSDDYDFLYNYALEQTERVQELKKQNKRYREALKNILEDLDLNTVTVVNRDNFNWLIEQAGRVQELEKRIKELEYASKYNGKLNEFLQKRKLPPNILGRHVVEVVMDYVEELEQQNKRYREYLELIRKTGTHGRIISTGEIIRSDEANLAEEALESESDA